MFRVVEREASVFRRLWHTSVFSGIVSPILFLGAMGLGLGGLVDAHTGRGALGGKLDYLQFIAPGLLAASAMQSCAGNALWPVMGGVKWIRYYHGMVSAPLAAADVYWGTMAWNALRTCGSAAIFLTVATLFGAIESPEALLAIPAAALCGLAFAAPLAAFTATQETDLSFPMIMRLGVVPLFLFSGTFFPVSQLPERLQPLALISPLWHGVELCRAAATGTLRFVPALGHVAVLVACIAVGGAFGTRTFERRLAG